MSKNRKNSFGFRRLTALFATVFAVVFCVFLLNSAKALSSVTTINSSNKNFEAQEEGAWKITQTATASSSSEAELVIKANSILKGDGKDKDIYIMLDTSGSMTNDRIRETTSAISKLADTMLNHQNGDNRMAMAAFNSEITDVSHGWKNDAMLFRLYMGDYLPSAIGGTDYYSAIKQIDSVFENYEYSEDRDAIVLFITDGAPVENHPLEEAEYRVLKEKYPWLIVQGIQFEMGDTIIEQIKKVSDNQFASDLENVEDVVFEAALDGYKYSTFDFSTAINDDYYEIVSADATMGNVSIDGSNIDWDMSGQYRSGTRQSLTVKLNVKQACIGKDDSICPVERSSNIKTQLRETPDESTQTNETPVLQFRFNISYDLNAPDGCDEGANSLPATAKQLIYTEAQISDYVPTCEGYQFRGWAIVSDIAYRYNENYFQMPEEDVILRAIWAKPTVSKTMDGTIAPTTYATFKKASPNTGWPAASRNAYNSLYESIAGSRENVEHIVYSTDTPPIDVVLDEAHNFAAADSELPIYGYYIPETKTFYFYSDADVVVLNKDSRGFLAEFPNLLSIEGIDRFDATQVESLDYLFYRTKKLANPEGLRGWKTPNLKSLVAAFCSTQMTSLSGVEGWDVSKVTSMRSLVDSSTNLTDISALLDWETDSLSDLSYAFNSAKSLSTLHGLENWNTQGVDSLYRTFTNTNMLADTSALSGWDTSNVTNMDGAFMGNKYETQASYIDMSGVANWNVSNVTNMSSLFGERRSLTTLEALRNWRPVKVTSLNFAFGVTNITTLEPLSEWRTPELQNMDSMFMDCEKLENVNGLAGWNVSKVTNMTRLFARDEKITSLAALSEWQTGELTTLSQAFWNTGVTSAAGLEDWDVRKVTSMSGMFQGANRLTTVRQLSQWDTESLTNIASMLDANYRTPSLLSLQGLENWKVGKVRYMQSFLNGQSKITSLSELSLWRPVAVENMNYAFSDNAAVTSLDGLQNWRTPVVQSMESTFGSMKAIMNVNQLADWTVGTSKTFAKLFVNDYALTNISGLSNWDTHSTTAINSFLESVPVSDITPISGWTTDNVTDMGLAFYGTKITNTNALSGWNVEKVTRMWRTFQDNKNLTSLAGLSSWQTNALVTASEVFKGCTSLTSLNGLGGWNMSRATTIGGMFEGDTSLSDISALSNWSTGSIKTMDVLFHNDRAITDISPIANWNVESVTNLRNAFEGATGIEDFSVLNGWQLPANADKSNAFKNTSATAILPEWL